AMTIKNEAPATEAPLLNTRFRDQASTLNGQVNGHTPQIATGYRELPGQTSNPALDGALMMLKAGYAVQPCHLAMDQITGKKDPTRLPKRWDTFGQAEHDVRRALSSWANAYMVSTGPSNIVVADIDVKGGAQGMESWAGKPQGGLVVRTPTGGLHHYFANDAQVGCPSSGLPGVDIRGIGGGVFGPGSLDGAYRIEHSNGGSLPPWSGVGLASAARTPSTQEMDAALRPAVSREHAEKIIAAKVQAVHNHAGNWAGNGFRTTLYGSAYTIGGYVGAELLSHEQAEARLTAAITSAGHEPDADDEKWIEQGLTDGSARPLQICESVAAVVSAPTAQMTGSAARGASTIIDGVTFLNEVGDDEPPIWGDSETCLWAAGEPMMIAGPPEVGKSTLAQLVVWGVLGLMPEVLGYPIRSDGRGVLYLAMDRPKQIARAMRRLATPEAAPVLRERLSVQRGPLPVSFSHDPDWVLREAVERGAGTVVVDSLKDLVPKLSDEEMAGAYNAARQRCLAEGIEWIELHHNRKANGGNEPKELDDIYGNRMITAGAGSVLNLHGQPGDTVVRLTQLKAPSGELFPKWVAIDKETGRLAMHEDVTIDIVLATAGGAGITARATAER
ncbi:MAG: bifunctional DNA primase/polymerase, partial [Mycobacteriales bacterium]